MLRRLCLVISLTACISMPALANYEEGEAAYNKKDWGKAIAELRPAAEAGDSRALFTLGKMYLDGNGVIADPAEAMSLYVRSAALNNTLAMISIGSMYNQGIGCRKDPKLASQWFLRAAELGDQLAAFFAGLLLFQGDTANPAVFGPDPKSSYKWLKIATAANTYPRVREAALSASQAVANRLSPLDRAQVEKDIKEWKPKTPAALGPLPSEQPKPSPAPKSPT